MITNGVTAGAMPAPRVPAAAGPVAGGQGGAGALQALTGVAAVAAPTDGGFGAQPQDPATLRMMERLVRMQTALAERPEGSRARAAVARPAAASEALRAEVTTAAVVLARATEAEDSPRAARMHGPEPAILRQPGAESLPSGAAFGVNDAAQRYAAAVLAARAQPGAEPRRARRGRGAPLPDDMVFEPYDDADDPPQDARPVAPDSPHSDARRLYGAAIDAGPQGVSVRISEVVELDPGLRPVGVPRPSQERIRLDPGAEVLLQLDDTLADWQVTRAGDTLTVRFSGGEVTLDGIARAGVIGIGVGRTAPIVILNAPAELDRDL